jgi:hypothetical protein
MDVSRFLVAALGAAWLGLAPAVLAAGFWAEGLTCFFCWSLVLGAFSRFLVAALGAAWLGLAPAVLAAGFWAEGLTCFFCWSLVLGAFSRFLPWLVFLSWGLAGLVFLLLSAVVCFLGWVGVFSSSRA